MISIFEKTAARNTLEEVERMGESFRSSYREPLSTVTEDDFRKRFGWPSESSKIGEGGIAQVFSSINNQYVLKFINHENGLEHALQEAIAYARIANPEDDAITTTPIAECRFDFKPGFIIAVPYIEGINRYKSHQDLRTSWPNESLRSMVSLNNDAGTIMTIVEAIQEGSSHSLAIRDIKLDGVLLQTDKFGQLIEGQWMDYNAAFILPQKDKLFQASRQWENILEKLSELELLPSQNLASNLGKFTTTIRSLAAEFKKVGEKELKAKDYLLISVEIRSLLEDLSKLRIVDHSLGDERSVLSELINLSNAIPSMPLFGGGKYPQQVKSWLNEINVLFETKLKTTLEELFSLATIVEMVQSKSFDNITDLMVQMVGFTDSSLMELVGAETLKQTYLDKNTEEVLEGKLFTARFGIEGRQRDIAEGKGIYSSLGKLENPFQIWYLIFQQEMDKDWLSVRDIIADFLKKKNGRSKTTSVESQLIKFNSLRKKRADLIKDLVDGKYGLNYIDKRFSAADINLIAEAKLLASV